MRSQCTLCIFSVCYKIAFTWLWQVRNTTSGAVELTLNFIEKCKVNVTGKLKLSEGIPAILVKNSSKVYTR